MTGPPDPPPAPPSSAVDRTAVAALAKGDKSSPAQAATGETAVPGASSSITNPDPASYLAHDFSPDPEPTPVMKLMFDQDLVHSLISERSFDKLHVYLEEFIARAPHEMGKHRHHGLMLTALELELGSVVMDGKNAVDLFKDKIIPMLTEDRSWFTPYDLLDRVNKIGFRLKKSNFPEAWMKSTTMKIFDYIRLHFPDFIRPDADVSGDYLLQFCETYTNDSKQTCYRCLACGYVLPQGQKLSYLRRHLKTDPGSGNMKSCEGRSDYVLQKLEKCEKDLHDATPEKKNFKRSRSDSRSPSVEFVRPAI